MSHIKLLIVEDDSSLRGMYQFKFEHSGFLVETADDGKQGLLKAEQFQPDIILLDLMMPEMNGDEALAAIRSTEWGASIRVIILTNLSKSEAPMGLRFLGVDRYIVKAHTTPAEVVRIAEEVLGLRRGR